MDDQRLCYERADAGVTMNCAVHGTETHSDDLSPVVQRNLARDQIQENKADDPERMWLPLPATHATVVRRRAARPHIRCGKHHDGERRLRLSPRWRAPGRTLAAGDVEGGADDAVGVDAVIAVQVLKRA